MAREARAPRARPRGPRHWGVCFRASRFSTTAKRKKKREKTRHIGAGDRWASVQAAPPPSLVSAPCRTAHTALPGGHEVAPSDEHRALAKHLDPGRGGRAVPRPLQRVDR